MSKRIIVLLLLLFLSVSGAHSYYFGQNKVRYNIPEWQLYETDNFLIHLYGPWEAKAEEICRIAEEAFAKVTVILQHTPRKKIPLFIYDSDVDFWGTNITDAPLGEGVGGFTEVLKNRVVLPIGGSLQAFESVLTHEVTHAVQFSLLYGDDMRAFNLVRSIFVPIWIMEGMAEHCADDWDATGEMVLRYAVLKGETIPPKKLSSFTLLGDKIYLAYKQSQSLVDYIAEKRGRSKIALLLKGHTKQMSTDQMIDEIFSGEHGELLPEKRNSKKIKYKFEDLYKDWLRDKEKEYWRQISALDAPELKKQVLEIKSRANDRASTPRWSPDGAGLAYFLRQGDAVSLKVYYPASGKDKTLLKAKSYQALRTDSLDWSPDGKHLALAVLKDGGYILLLVDVAGKRQELRVGNGFLRHPVFSPDGEKIAFVDQNGDGGNIYLYQLSQNLVQRITDGPARDASPFWRADGRLCFLRADDDGSAFMILDDKHQTPQRLYHDQRMKKSPGFSADGKYIIFVSDWGGVPNIFKLDLDNGALRRLTAVQGGAFSPSVSPDGKLIAFSEYLGRTSKLCVTSAAAGVAVNKEPDAFAQGEILEPKKRLSGETKKAIKKASPRQTATSALLPPLIALDDLAGEAQSRAEAIVIEDEVVEGGAEPPSVPGRPSSLTAKAGNKSVILAWERPAKGSTAPNNYRIYRCDGSSGWREIYQTVSPEATSYVDRELENGRKYEYMVVAVNEQGAGVPSEMANGVPQLNIARRPYRTRLGTDLVFLLLSYDARAGVVGLGFYRTSDLLGNHRLSLYLDSLPDIRRGGRLNYQYLKHRMQLGLDFYYMENQYYVYDFYNGSIENQLWENVFGGELTVKYPLSVWHRLEFGFGSRKVAGGMRNEGILFERDITKDLLVLGVINSVSAALVRERVSFHGMVEVGGSRGKIGTTFASPYLGGTANFSNYFFDLEAFRAVWPLAQPLVAAVRLLGVNSVGRNKVKIYSGGVDSLRGFGYASFASSMVYIFNAELRTPLLPELHLALWPLNFFVLDEVRMAIFYDGGIIADRFHEINRYSTVQSAGVGFRFYCFLFARQPLVLRLDIARPIDRDAEERYQFALGQMF